MTEPPIVRYLIPCEEIRRSDDGKLVLLNTFHVIRLKPGAIWPHVHPIMWLFGLVTSGRGRVTFQVEQTIGVGGAEETVHLFRPSVVDLGNDPLWVHGMPIGLQNVQLPRAGQITFRLNCDGNEVADAKIDVRNPR